MNPEESNPSQEATGIRRFRYAARSIDGRRMEGEVLGTDMEEATRRLQEAGVYVITISSIQKGAGPLFPYRISLSEQDRIFLLESWAMFLEAGLPMQSALLRVRLRTDTPSVARAIDQIQEAIDNGATLSEALQVGRLFPPSWVSVLSVAETHGDFVQPIRMLQHRAEQMRHFKQELFSIFIMPAILLGLVGVWFWIFVVKVIPALALFMEQVGGSPFIPQLLMFGVTTVQWGTQFLAVLGGIIFLVTWFARRADREMGLLQAWVPPSIPVIGTIISYMNLIILSVGLQLQLEAGIALPKAIESLSHGVPSQFIRRQLLQVYRRLQEGIPVPEAIVHLRVIPPMGRALLVTGYASGKMPEMLDFLAREAQASLLEYVKRLTVMIRSFVVLATGFLVGMLLVAFFGMLYANMDLFAIQGQNQMGVQREFLVPVQK